MAVITITSDTTWTTDQTNTDGYIVRGCTLTIDAVTKGSDLRVICGASNAGDFTVEDDAKIKFITDDTKRVIVGGTSASNSRYFWCYGVIETDYQGSTDTKTVLIGTDGTNITQVNATHIEVQPKDGTLENMWFVGDYAYVVYEGCGTGILWKNCHFGNGTEVANLGNTRSPELWFETCNFDASGAFIAYTVYGCIFNMVGPQTGNSTRYTSIYIDTYRIWNRAYLRFVDSGSNPISGLYVTLMDSTGKFSWTGVTGADGKLDSNTKFGIDYLLAIASQDDDFYGTTTYSSAGNPSVLYVYDPSSSYASYSTTHDMSSDWGSSGSYIDIELTASGATPTISNTDIIPETISYLSGESVTFTCDIANAETGYGNYVKINGKVFDLSLISGTTYATTIPIKNIGVVSGATASFYAENSIGIGTSVTSTDTLTTTIPEITYANLLDKTRETLRNLLIADTDVVEKIRISVGANRYKYAIYDGEPTENVRNLSSYIIVHTPETTEKSFTLSQTPKMDVNLTPNIEVRGKKEEEVRKLADAVRNALYTNQETTRAVKLKLFGIDRSSLKQTYVGAVGMNDQPQWTITLSANYKYRGV